MSFFNLNFSALPALSLTSTTKPTANTAAVFSSLLGLPGVSFFSFQRPAGDGDTPQYAKEYRKLIVGVLRNTGKSNGQKKRSDKRETHTHTETLSLPNLPFQL
ncbi:hypothetical protein, unlikely [Trypanosoma brucei gambiense DAL972]|uniref:Uncharacterized protein n=1 Tax=Trypanosoma brucei gambiense (strain MHOM/CI/86/DAL972) TaxID=679716 RepID=C9ZVA4_TRYB9|nr:hypothetical protein, unlikely [Trypanosoma brucei gambiense DAL972]CBH13342.1 hypothetical protein, unlikely [Trypanosoma brucei gambiense DAL972]|eukprot:XP_011775619.1 hypothetical protein, unlikely [Trypanosoma brucei gambiense DAL972]